VIAVTIVIALVTIITVTLILMILTFQRSVEIIKVTVANIGGSLPVITPTSFGCNSTPGASQTGRYFWSGNGVNLNTNVCPAPMWGPSCNLQSYDANYIAIGNPDNMYPRVTQTINDVKLSFDGSSSTCTSICDATNGCTGVIWNSDDNITGTCHLLEDSLVIQPYDQLNYNPLQQSSLYLKERPMYNDVVYAVGGEIPKIFRDGCPGITKMYLDKLYEVDHPVTGFINDGGYAIYSSDKPFQHPSEAKLVDGAPPPNYRYFMAVRSLF
jgi:hypothetical protein